MDIEEAIKKGLTRPEYWYGPDWCYTEFANTGLSLHRDSNLIDKSNWESIVPDLKERFPEDVETLTSPHWAVGWIEELFVRPYDAEGNVTEAFKAAFEYAEQLQEYPLIDENKYSELQYEATLKNISWEGVMLIPGLHGSPQEREACERIFDYLWGQDIYPGGDDETWYSYEEIEQACRSLGI